jgi:hypothetical protein
VSLHVIPNLSLAPMLPRMALHTVRLGASTAEFIASEHATDHYPVHPRPLAFDIDRSAVAVAIRDERGATILEMKRTAAPAADYQRDRFYVQSFTENGGQGFAGGNFMEFDKTESQKDLAGTARIFEHELFAGLAVGRVSARDCYVQMWSKPGMVGRENHFWMKPYRR